MSSSIHRVIVGTAGHIDHGKSTLVRTLTGIDPDRLKEEKARGMTIDLGFAPYRTEAGPTVGIIDVPGHERFVKNMVAGASSVDLFLLVVAADDGVMPQTREHVDILDLLGARRGVVAVTKIDLVDPELRELAIADIHEYLAGTPFRDAPLVPISSATGEGIARLREVLDQAIAGTAAHASGGLFRMPIQRVFSAHGHGTVVTGVPISGSVEIGDVLEILPQGASGKVRGIQAYLEERPGAAAGHSTALNLADVDYRSIARGDVVVAPGYFKASTLLEAELRVLASAQQPLAHGAEVRVHVGTTEAIARLAVLDRPEIAPGETALVQLRLAEPIVACRGDRFLVRQPSPAVTLGGGVIVSESERRVSRAREEATAVVRRKAAAIADPREYLCSVLAERGPRPTLAREVAALLKLPEPAAEAVLAAAVAAGQVAAIGRDRVLDRSALDVLLKRLRQALKDFHKQNPLRLFADALKVRTALGVDEALFDALVEQLVANGEVSAQKGGRLALASAVPKLSTQDEADIARIAARLSAAALAPPDAAELAAEFRLLEKTVRQYLLLLAERGEVVRAGDVSFAAAQVGRALDVVRQVARENGGEVLVPMVRDRLGTTRKFLIPLLESFDSRGLTVRRGERRYLVERTNEASG